MGVRAKGSYGEERLKREDWMPWDQGGCYLSGSKDPFPNHLYPSPLEILFHTPPPNYLNLPGFSSIPSLEGFWFLGLLPRSCPPSEQKVGEEGLLLCLYHLPHLLPGNPGSQRLVLRCVRSWAA